MAEADWRDREIETLRARVAELEAALGVGRQGFQPPLEWGLRPSHARVMGVLVARDLATKDAIMTALVDGRPDADAPEPKIVDVHICAMRKKLRPFGIEIRTVWGRGYALDPAVRERLRAGRAG